MLATNRYVLVGAGVAMLAVLLLVKKNGIAGAGAAVGEAAADAVGGVVSGAAQGVGDWFGIPRTNETECEKAIREGRYWDASFACPAGTFIGAAADGVGGAISDAAGSVFDTFKNWWE